MPAMAVTEHGNMFSSVIFHDHARKRGLKPILGCEVYVAPGDRRDQERHAGRDGQPSGAAGRDQRGLPQPDQAGVGRLHRGLLLQAAHRQGAARAAREGADRPEQLPQGRGRRAASAPSRQRKALDAAAAYRDILGPEQLLPRDAVPGHRGAADRQQRPAADRARSRTCRWSCTNDVHYLRQGDSQPHDILLCIGTGKTVNDAKRLRYHGDQFFLKTAERDGGRCSRTTRTRWRTRCASPSAATSTIAQGQELPAELRRAGRLHARRLLRARRPRRASRSGCRGCSSSQAAGALRHTDRRVRAPALVRDRHDQADEVPGYFLIVWDFIRYAREQGIPVGPGPRIGRRQPGRLLPAHHRRRSARLRPDLRALPQPRARVAARYRHRLLRAAPRRGDRLRHAEVRPRERRADHHVRHDEGAGRRARRRPRPRHAVSPTSTASPSRFRRRST